MWDLGVPWEAGAAPAHREVKSELGTGSEAWGLVPRIRSGCLAARAPPAPCVCPSLPQVDPYLPYEYTCEGMLERIHAYIQHQVGGPSPGTLLSSEERAPLPRALCP